MSEYSERIADLRGWRWQPITTGGLIAFLAGAGWLFLIIARDHDGFLSILDSFNLVIHEFGHPFFGVLGEQPMFWGGTLAQLLVPLGITAVFWYQRTALSMCLAGIWFFQNFLNIARYIGDARAQELPLVGGGEHDWATILGHNGWLEHDTAIAGVVRTIGWTGMIAFVALAMVLWYLQQERAEDAVEVIRQRA